MSIRPSTVVDEYIKLKPFQEMVRHQKNQFHFFLIYCFYCTSIFSEKYLKKGNTDIKIETLRHQMSDS